MKRLAAAWVILLVLAWGAQAYGNVLVYNLFGVAQTVDTASDDGDTKLVTGYMVLDVNNVSATADASSIILYGRERRSRVYTIYDDVVNLTKYGDYIAVMIDTGTGNTIVLTGRIRTVRIGAWRRGLVLQAANSLSGAISFKWGTLFDLDESLVGAGAMQASLNNQLTRNNYSSPDGVEEAVDAILTNLEARGYQYLSQDEEPPVPDEPDDGEDEEPQLPT